MSLSILLLYLALLHQPFILSNHSFHYLYTTRQSNGPRSSSSFGILGLTDKGIVDVIGQHRGRKRTASLSGAKVIGAVHVDIDL